MVHEMIEGTYRQTNLPDESPDRRNIWPSARNCGWQRLN
jgi:hypothetical protein